MTQNPFGEGGFDLSAMMEQAQAMQSQLMQAQDELARTLVDGAAGGVQVQVNGVGEVHGVTIPVGRFDGGDEDSLSDLQDLIVAAYRDAKTKADEVAGQVMGPFAGGAEEDLMGSLGFGTDPGQGQGGGHGGLGPQQTGPGGLGV